MKEMLVLGRFGWCFDQDECVVVVLSKALYRSDDGCICLLFHFHRHKARERTYDDRPATGGTDGAGADWSLAGRYDQAFFSAPCLS